MVQDVNSASISVVLSDQHSSGLVFIHGQIYCIGQMGNFMKISEVYIDLFGIISQDVASALAKVTAYKPANNAHRWLMVQLIGEAYRKGKF
ncbi:MAG: hypothetical protein ACMUEM_04295 [Flavobacteriales bacterium AspAUS03]